jgi:hypothetical protein
MGTVPTGQLERELRKRYLRWLSGLRREEELGNLSAYIDLFQRDSEWIIKKFGGQAASLGALADFPVPKTLELSPRAGVVYDEMKQAAIRASITAGLQSTDAARAMLRAGLDVSFRKLNRLARTETVSAYWKNSWDSIADLPTIVMVWGSEESKRTCEYCLSRDGLVVEDPNIRDHPNGRCTLIPTPRSQVKYKGTLQPDGSIDFDPRWTGKAPKSVASAGPTTAAQRDPLSGKSNPAAPSVAQPVHQSAPRPTGPVSIDAKPITYHDVHIAPLTEAERKAVQKYKGVNAAEQRVVDKMNADLRAGKVPSSQFRKDLDAAVAKGQLTQDSELWRGIAARPEDMAQYVPGARISFPGFTSTSAQRKTAAMYANLRKEKFPNWGEGIEEYIFKLVTPKGTPIAQGDQYSHEIVIGRGSSWLVQSIDGNEITIVMMP